jgi:DNA (cytosine-5)-methyltransferase 1
MSPRIGSLFSGYGGLDMAVESVTGGRTVWVSDIDPGARKILAHNWPGVPNIGDITKVDWSQVEPVDIITGGSPCQDVSAAAHDRKGMTTGTRSNLWVEMSRAVDYLRPSLVVWENVRGVFSAKADSEMELCAGCVGKRPDRVLRALGRVLGDLSDIGYDAAWHGLEAAEVGAPHRRFRVFVIAWPVSDAISGRWDRRAHQPIRSTIGRDAATGRGQGSGDVPDPERIGHPRWRNERQDTQGTGARGEPGGSDIRPNQELGALFDVPEDPGAGPDFSWQQYAPFVRRWEALTRPAPRPTMRGGSGARTMAPRFVEWMMGLPDGHVTGVPGTSREEQLKALGNGVIPLHAQVALTRLFDALPAEVAA